ncbi:MAG: peptidoglycan editing factor PgeF [Lachnospiraceae bacterium]
MIWKDGRQVPQLQERNGIPYLQFQSLEKVSGIRHLFTTRGGGVSEGIYESMNLGFTRGDRKECVEENFRRIAGILGCMPEDMIAADQTHTANVRLVTAEDKGHGITAKKKFYDTDGMVTNEAGIVLATFYADCVPLYFVDPVKRAIGLSHAGWKGTVQGIGEVTVKKMTECFGSQPEDIIAAIGPSICADCYEVGEDVAEAFLGEFWERYHNNGIQKLTKVEKERSVSMLQEVVKKDGTLEGEQKFHLNLWAANRCVLEKAGILPEHIEVTGLCTCCNSRELFSHRASCGQRGNLGAFLGLI